VVKCFKIPDLIDGHNLAASIPGISLDQIDDESALIKLLEGHFAHIRRHAEIFFDKAFPGQRKVVRRAFLVAHFISEPGNADHAIIKRIKELKGNARNYTVVTSDKWVANQAASLGARVVSSQVFSQSLNKPKQTLKPDEQVQDVAYWLEEFNRKQE
jgi:predicted RNA-binding protein with PIN domain